MPALITTILAAVQALSQIVPVIEDAVKLLQGGNATQADVDAAVAKMDAAVAAWSARKQS